MGLSELVKIDNDLFCIAERLKQIDDRYELFFNGRLNRFEVYANGALQIAAPFDRLDCRLLSLVRETRMERLDALLADIDKNNSRLDA